MGEAETVEWVVSVSDNQLGGGIDALVQGSRMGNGKDSSPLCI